jgi:putative heme-binding domain-containing protein
VRGFRKVQTRFGRPETPLREQLIRRLDPLFPADAYEVNADLSRLLFFLDAPGAIGKTLGLMAAAPTQEEQIDYARSLCRLGTGWTLAQRRHFFTWCVGAGRFRGGQSVQPVIENIRQAAEATLTPREREKLRALLQPASPHTTEFRPRPAVRKWTVAELAPVVVKGLTGRNFERGRRIFGEAGCFTCHRFAGEGGTWAAPDLTSVSGRYGVRDLLESILEPSKVVSDQYAVTMFTLKDGTTLRGRVMEMYGGRMFVITDMMTGKKREVDVRDVEEAQPGRSSPMPEGLLDGFGEEEVLDLVAYLLSRGDRTHEMFSK